jgi:CHAT domain-containing protein
MYTSQLINRKHPQILRIPKVTAWIPEYTVSTENGSDRLKGAAEEVEDILGIFKGRTIRNTKEKTEVGKLLQDKSIIHLAMHSLANEGGGESPYFILDTINDPMLGDRMYNYEISALLLTTPMVVLSSCETAAGKLQRGEGIMSLSRSFLQAGAKSVVHSLWPVEDIKGRDIMIGFYGELKRGHSKSNALSTVKKRYLKSNPPFYTHPYYWASFQITGDTSPLYSKWRTGILTGSIMLVFVSLFYWKRRSFFRRA